MATWRLLGRALVKRRFVLQWHLTDRCNLRCDHCYQERFQSPELSGVELRAVLSMFRDLVGDLRSRRQGEVLRPHINFTGGEPFVREDFLDFLAEIQYPMTFGILTNGTLVDASLARRLSQLGPAFVQVSIDGMKHTHDEIRGAGTFEQATAGIRHLVRAGVCCLISFTAHRQNYREFPRVADLGQELGVRRVWADRLIPMGNGTESTPLSASETREFLMLMRKSRDRHRRRWFKRTEVGMHRALQFLAGGGRPYRCSAGRSLLTIAANGEVFPCRRMPIRVGNVLNETLATIYEENPTLQGLRDEETVAEGCAGCSHERACRGGLRCLSYAAYGEPFRADPGCWLAAPVTDSLPDCRRQGLSCSSTATS